MTNIVTEGSVDPNVHVPAHVKAGIATADALHQQFYPKDPAQPAAPAKEALPQPAQPEPVRQVENQPEPVENQPVQAQPVETPAPRADDQNVTADEWRHRFLSMQGRYQAQVRNNASMEEQMRQLGEELVRTQSIMLAQPRTAPADQRANSDTNHGNLITDADRENYGDELIDLARRAALSSVTPELEQLRADNQRLTQRVQHTGKRELFATLDGAVPNWRAIEKSIQFKTWLRLPNVYTGQVRNQMLKAAVDGAEAPKVIALLKDFLAEAAATGQTAPAAQTEQPALQTSAPREPALALETLAAPGRARPASGDSQVPTEKPNYSRAQISQFYRDVNKGLFAGRDAEYRAQEADFQAAMREGRIR